MHAPYVVLEKITCSFAKATKIATYFCLKMLQEQWKTYCYLLSHFTKRFRVKGLEHASIAHQWAVRRLVYFWLPQRNALSAFKCTQVRATPRNLRSLSDRYPCRPMLRYSWTTSRFIKRELFVRKRRQRVRRYSLHLPIRRGTTQWKRPFRYSNTATDGRNKRFQQWRRKLSLIL